MIGVLILTGIALFFSILLVFLDNYLKKEDPKVEEIKKRLPGYNCGSCGFGSCEGMAKAILENPENCQKCRPMKEEMRKQLEAYLIEQNLIKKTNQ